jgi:hypothetical protein
MIRVGSISPFLRRAFLLTCSMKEHYYVSVSTSQHKELVFNLANR